MHVQLKLRNNKVGVNVLLVIAVKMIVLDVGGRALDRQCLALQIEKH